MEIILPILIMLAYLYFRLGPGSRLLKKKSHHYQIPPDPENDPNWRPIKMNDYQFFICLKQTTPDYIDYKSSLIIANHTKNNTINYHFDSDWHILQTNGLNFHEYHNLISELYGFHGEGDRPAEVLGMALHHNNNSKDYIIKFDLEAEDEFLLGAFSDNTNFVIYLPKSDRHPEGNISLSPVTEIYYEDFRYKLPLDKISELIHTHD